METLSAKLAMPHARRAQERLVSDLRKLTRDAEHLLQAAAEDVTDKASDARKQIIDVIERVKASCEGLQERSLESARAAVKHTDHAVRTHPYQSVGIAFGVGVLVGWLVSRK